MVFSNLKAGGRVKTRYNCIMKQIYCLRHAHALNADGQSDKERRLSAQGVADAAALGRVMHARGYVPDLVLCSSAVRTRMTLEAVSEAFADALVVRFEDILYSGSLGDYLALVQAVAEDYSRVLVVGHNPIIHALAVNLAAEEGSSHFLSDIMSRYAPCTLSVFDVAADHWGDASPYANALVDVVVGDGV